jgi:tRNA A-37 threonylcarbamoyl transferase component Bud32
MMADSVNPGRDDSQDDSADNIRNRQTVQIPPTPQSLQANLPSTIGPFSIRRVIGSGGMGIVYEAMQESPRRKVAIKVMKRGITSSSALRRFQFESQVLARLHHPGIAQIYEAGTWDDGTGGVPFFAMEFIAGAKTLNQFSIDKKLDTPQKLELFARVCDAVHHGHQKGIIHRDLKPGNILIDRQGNPKVIDFGVARSTDSDLAVTTQQTDVGALVGTLQYMSPEQCEADPDIIDTRSDVYAMGVVLYQMLCGKAPYDLESVPIFDAAKIVREQPPTRLSVVSPLLRGDLETIVSKAMAKDPEYRYQSALELKQDLERYVKGEPISARPLSLTYQLSLLMRRNKAAVVATMAIAAVLVAATAVSIVLAVKAHRAQEVAVASQQQVEAELSKAAAQKLFLQSVLGMASPRNAQGRTLNTQQVLQEAAAGIDARFTNLPELAAETRLMIGELMFELQMFADADQELTAGIAAIEARQGPSDPRVLHALAVMGRLRTDQGRPRQSDHVTQDLLERARKSLPADDPILIEALASRVQALQFLTRLPEAMELSREWYNTATRRHGEAHEQALDAKTTHAFLVLQNSGLSPDKDVEDRMAAEGLELLEEASETSGASLGSKHPITLHAEAILALVQWLQAAKDGQLEGEEAVLIQATEALQQVLGEDHTAVLGIVHIRGFTTYLIGSQSRDDEILARGEMLLARAHEGYQRRFGPDNPLAQSVMVRLRQARANISGVAIDSDELRDSYEQLLTQHAPDHHIVINARASLAYVLLDKGEIEEGEPLMRTSIEMVAEILNPYHANVIRLKFLLLGSLVEFDQADRALAQFDIWLAEARDQLGAGDKSFIDLQLKAARLYDLADRDEAAYAIRKEAWESAKAHLEPDSTTRHEAVRSYASSLLKHDEPEPALELIDEAIEHSDAAEEPEPVNRQKLSVLRADALAQLDRVDEARSLLTPLLAAREEKDPREMLQIVSYVIARDSERLLALDADALIAAAMRVHDQSEDGSERLLAMLHFAMGNHAQAVHWQELHLDAAKQTERETVQEELDEYRAAMAEAERAPAEVVETPSTP